MIPTNLFGCAGLDSAEERVERIDEDVVLSSLGHNARNAKYCRATLLKPPISDRSRDGKVFGIPARMIGCVDCLNGDATGDVDPNETMILRRSGSICMDENLQQSTGVRLGGVDDWMARGVPATAFEHGTGTIEDRVPSVRDAIGRHGYTGSP